MNEEPQSFGGSLTDVVTALKGVVTNLSQLNATFNAVIPRINGTFTLANATTTVVTQPLISASGIVLWSPTNATAALTVRTAGLYVSAVTAGVSFSLSTQVGSAAGTEQFKYVVINPS